MLTLCNFHAASYSIERSELCKLFAIRTIVYFISCSALRFVPTKREYGIGYTAAKFNLFGGDFEFDCLCSRVIAYSGYCGGRSADFGIVRVFKGSRTYIKLSPIHTNGG